MSGAVELASYVARRAAQRERVRLLYRQTLKDTLNWAVQRHIFLPRLPWAPGGSKFTRNPPPPPTPPPGIEVVYDYGKEDDLN